MHNSLEYTKNLEAAGIPAKQAEAQVQMITDIINSELVTRQDLREQTAVLRSEIKTLEIQLRADMTNLEDRLIYKMELLESHLTLKLGSIIVASLGAFTAIIHFIH